jgi:hypothetical protein
MWLNGPRRVRTQKGGSAMLRYVSILVLSVLAAILALPSAPTQGASYVVDTTSDDGSAPFQACTGAPTDCSLRGAIARANAASTPGDIITFDPAVFPPNPAPTAIVSGSALSLTAGSDTIDGTGANVLIDGVNAEPNPSVFPCIHLNSSNNTVSRIQVTDCQSGVQVPQGANNVIGPGIVAFDNTTGITFNTTASGGRIFGNFVGTNSAGTAVHPDGGNNTGLSINSPNTEIGGDSVGDRNVIAGNTGAQISLTAASAAVSVMGNYIGTDVLGTTDLGGNGGISISGDGHRIGGTGAGEGNLISGNTSNIVFGGGVTSTGVLIAGNIIGPDATGGGASMTNGAGIAMFGGSGNVISGNLISDNINGIHLSGAAVANQTIIGNKIGTDPTGTTAVPNSAGVSIESSAHDNDIGGIAPGESNIIAFNTGIGVRVSQVTTVRNSIRGNSIHDNVGLEVDNSDGGNTELPPPVLSSAGAAAAAGTACANCIIDVFSDGAGDAEFYEGSAVADGAGNFIVLTSIAGPNVTATATDTDGNTSELSGSLGFTPDSDGDGVPDLIDNCPDNDNVDQADIDGDGLGDICDANIDGDDLDNDVDPCPTLAEDYDGFEDGDGCTDTDNDLDGICDPGTSSVACTGEDQGAMCFDPAGTLPCPASNCQNIAEDYDSFKDFDGCPEPDNDNDGFTDGVDQCPGVHWQTGADGMFGAAQDLNHNGISDGGEDTLTTDDVTTYQFEDRDGVLDTDGCHDSPGEDFDGDEYTDDNEALKIGTNAGYPCGGNGWPSDVFSSGGSANKLNIQDVLSFVIPVRHYDTSPPSSSYDARWDLVPGPTIPFPAHINIVDITALVNGTTGNPPMFNSTRAFDQTCPLAAQ